MRAAAALSVLFVAACTGMRGGGSGSSEVVVDARPDTVLSVATRVLQGEGFMVSAAGPGAIVTQPRLVPVALQDTLGAYPGSFYFMRVTSERASYSAGSRLRVSGYIAPPPVTADTTVMQQSKVIRSANRALASEVQAVTQRIANAVQRRR